MKPFILLVLAGLVASCSLPMGDGTSLAAGFPGRPAGTASLTVSTPYGGGRAILPLQTIQTTVEPENLGRLFDHVTVVLDSLAQPNVTKTVPVGQASLIRIDGLYEASDWTMTVTAYDGSNSPVAAASFNQGGISTLKGQVTSLGDVFLNPIAGPGTGSFELNLLDLPAEVYPENTSWTLEPLNPDGSLGSAMAAGDLTKVSVSGTVHQLTAKTLVGQTIPTGSYRLTLTLRTLSGQALSWTPVYVVNVYPGLTSTKTVPGTTWPNPLPAPAITFPVPAATSNAGLVVTWQPNANAAVAGYEFYWIPATTVLPDPATFDPTFFNRSGTRTGYIAASTTSRYRPSWMLPAADIPAAQLVSSDWGFYVRAVTTTGTKGPWAASTVAVDVSFNVAIASVTLAGALADRYELRRLGPSSEAHLTVPPSGLINPEIASFVPLSRFAFTLGDPSTGTATLTLPEPWILAPGQQLVLANSTSIVPVRLWIDQTKPNQAPLDLYLYPQAVSTYDSTNEITVYETYCVAVSAPLPALSAGPGSDWTFRMPSPTAVESRITASAVGPITDPIVPPGTLNYQIVPLTYLSGTNTFQPAFDKSSTIAPDTWAAMLWTGGSEAVAARNVVARPVWNLGVNGTLYGAWSPLGWSPGVSAAPANVVVTVSTNVLSWDAVDDSTWGTAHVTGYLVDKVGGYPGLPLTLAPGVHQLNVSSYGVGDYTVTTLFQRADGRAGASAPAAWPSLVTMPSNVLSDLSDRRPGDAGYDSTQTRGRYTDISPDLYRAGAWLATGLAGSEGDVFVSRHLGSGNLDTDFGSVLGTTTVGLAYVPNGIFGGSYFDKSIGLSQSATSGQILIATYVQPGGGGYTRYSAYSFQGVEDTPNFNPTNGYVSRGPNRLPVGRLVRVGTNTFGLENLEPGYGVVKVADATGAISASGVLSNNGLYRIAVKDANTLLAIGDAGLVLRVSTSTLALDTATDISIWTTDGTATVTVNSVTPDWKDILVTGDGKILLTGWAGATGYVVRLLSTGALDTSFAGTGWVALPGLYPQDLAVNGSNEVAVTGDITATEMDTSLAFLKAFSATGTPNPWLEKSLSGTTVHGASARAVAYNGSRLMVAGFVRLSSNTQDTLPALWSF